jgi:hypothetical protein
MTTNDKDIVNGLHTECNRILARCKTTGQIDVAFRDFFNDGMRQRLVDDYHFNVVSLDQVYVEVTLCANLGSKHTFYVTREETPEQAYDRAMGVIG